MMNMFKWTNAMLNAFDDSYVIILKHYHFYYHVVFSNRLIAYFIFFRFLKLQNYMSRGEVEHHDLFELMLLMLNYEPQDRITAEKALEDRVFARFSSRRWKVKLVSNLGPNITYPQVEKRRQLHVTLDLLAVENLKLQLFWFACVVVIGFVRVCCYCCAYVLFFFVLVYWAAFIRCYCSS